jgi:hypothetical protein
VVVILLEYTGRLGCGSCRLHIKRRFPHLPMILLSAYSKMPRTNPVVGG